MASMVESVEFIEITQSGTETYTTVELTKGQNYENCVPFLTLHGCSDYMDSHFMDVSFSGTVSNGFINFERDETRSCAMNIKCYVVEFDPAEVKVQQGTFTTTPASTIAENTPESFTQTKTAMLHYWKSASSAQRWDYHLVRGRVLSNGTQVDFYQNEGSSLSGHYFLFEDISGDNSHFLVEHISDNYTGQNTNHYITLGEPDPTKTFVMGSWACSDGGVTYNDGQTCRFFMYSQGYCRSDRQTVRGTIYAQFQVITFTDPNKVYIMYQRHIGFGSSDTVINESWSRPCVLNLSSIVSTSPYGIARGSTYQTGEVDSLWTSMKLTSTTDAQFERNSTGLTSSSYVGYAVINWFGQVVGTGSNPSPLDPDISFVKSVENFRMTISVLFTYRDLTKGQDISNCALFISYRGENATANQIRDNHPVVWLREPGIVIAQRSSASGSTVVDISVVEFYPDQIKVQQGRFNSWDSTTDTVSIDEVSSLDKAFLLHSWQTNEATRWDRTEVRGRFTATDELDFYRQESGNLIDGSFFIIEDLGNNFEVEHSEVNSSSAALNYWSQNYHEVRATLPIASYAVSTGAIYTDRSVIRTYSTGNGGRLIINKVTGSETTYVYRQWVRFLDGKIHAQRLSPVMGPTTYTDTASIDSYHSGNEAAFSTYNPMQNSVGMADGTGAVNIRGAFHSYRLINSNTEIEISRDPAGGGNTLNPSWGGLIDWIGYRHPLANAKHEMPDRPTGTKSLVRSVEVFQNTGERIEYYFLTKGQIPENCVPFASWRAGSNDGYQERIHRHHYIDELNSKMIGYSETSQSAGDIDEIVYLVEFDPNQVKIQKIYATMTGTDFYVDIPQEVDLNKTFMWFSYVTDHWTRRWDMSIVVGEFNSSTQLRFRRDYSSNVDIPQEGVYLTIYLIECLQDQWFVTHNTVDVPNSSTNVYDYINFKSIGLKNRFIQGSYNVTTNAVYSDRSCYRLYPRQDKGFQWNKDNTSESMPRRNLEIVEFNENVGIDVGGLWTDFSSGETSETLYLTCDTPLDLERSIVCPTIVECINRVTGTSTIHVTGVCGKFELTASGTEIESSRYNGGNDMYGWFQWVQWPPYKTHYFEGNVTEKGIPVIRSLACYRTDTDELMDYTTSASGTGYYRLETSYSGSHYIVCKDDEPGDDYNDLIWGKMYPYLIEYDTVWGDA